MGEEHDLLALLGREREVFEEHCPIIFNGSKSFHLKDLIARFSIHCEDDARILTRGRLNLLHIQFLKHLLA